MEDFARKLLWPLDYSAFFRYVADSNRPRGKGGNKKVNPVPKRESPNGSTSPDPNQFSDCSSFLATCDPQSYHSAFRSSLLAGGFMLDRRRFLSTAATGVAD